ncbi:hypothetical protein NQ317_019687 [Molorchus minor]|uniref:D-isomer specific 2-hydroxyacid dehydrogenase NAD-binding domain-containing protein n=1 Tax=Molorchus minor TaxID=1323400 RepID=A0ABQ9J0M2_9CUCU|nr:hypothetical protein NQ317_019687 [Molorchus minor]
MSSVISVLSKIPNILKELQKTLPNIKFHQVEETDKDEEFIKSNIIIADFDYLAPHIYDLPNVKWIQGTWAGIDALLPHLKPNQPPSFPITRFSGKHFGHLIGEYVLANIINHERSMFEIKQNQSKQQWIINGKINDHRSLYDLTIGILGIGSIGNRVARILNFMGAEIFGYGRRTEIDMSNYKHISQYFNKDGLFDLLQKCDYIVNTLPNTADTKGLLNGNVLENCKEKGSVFVNVGRGSIIYEEYLVKALEKKWISAAILDVFDKEPLRSDSPLWKMPNVFISPHVSGTSRARDIAEQFSENLKLFQQNLPIPTTVDFSVGY